MKSQLTISILLILSIGLFSNLVYADHTDNMILSFDKDNYDYDETIKIDVQLLSPFLSNYTDSDGFVYETIVIMTFHDLFESTSMFSIREYSNSTGQASFEFPLMYDVYESGEFYVTGEFLTFYPDLSGSGYIMDNHQSDVESYLTLNTDYYTVTIKTIQDIEQVNSTAYINIQSIDTNTEDIGSVDLELSGQQSTIDGMYIHMEEIDEDIELLGEKIDEIDGNVTSNNSLITSLNNTIISQDIIITELRTDLDALTALVQELIDNGGLLSAPTITTITADDPDNLDDIYSADDTITITFDSDTNQPGGTEIQNRMAVDDLFTFTESIGERYRGQWTAADTFTITIKTTINPGSPVIDVTTVTPAQITLILPVDSNQESFSSNISSSLTGDWGIQ